MSLPPGQFVPAGTSPGAWDTIPQTALGQTWQVGAWVYAPPGVSVTLRPVLFAGPWQGAGKAGGTSSTIEGAGAWMLVTAPHQAEVAGAWVGVEVSAYPTGPAWKDASGTWADAAGTWEDVAAVYVDDVTVLAPAAGTVHTVLVFSGRITDLKAAWDDTARGPAIEVTAADFTADLANRDVGDEPWLVEPMADRFNRILELAGMDVTADIAGSVADIPVSWQDVDNQPATGLLQNLATTVDGVMWPAVHQTTGAYLKVEDPSGRASLYQLVMVDGIVQVVQVGEGGTVLSACDVLVDPVEPVQDVSDITTRAAVTWLGADRRRPGAAPAPPSTPLPSSTPTWRPSTAPAGSASRPNLVTLRPTRSTSRTGSWPGSPSSAGGAGPGSSWTTTDLDQAAQILTLLDGTSRIGLPVRVTDLPPWPSAGAELPVYLEGGHYVYADGRWVLDLNVSSARGQGQSVTWDETDPAWRWVDVDPQLSWSGVYGVAGPDLAEEKIAA